MGRVRVLVLAMVALLALGLSAATATPTAHASALEAAAVTGPLDEAPAVARRSSVPARRLATVRRILRRRPLRAVVARCRHRATGGWRPNGSTVLGGPPRWRGPPLAA